MSITDKDIEILLEQTHDTLAGWWCTLNRWGWPEDMPDPEGRDHEPGDRRGRIMSLIEWRVGHRATSRKWNKGMTDEYFEDFYRGTFEGDKEAKKRHEAALMASVLDNTEESRDE